MNSKKTKIVLTQEVLTDAFNYKDGLLIWRCPINHKVIVGSIAGCIRNSDGRRIVGLNGANYFHSRLVFLWHHGYMPKIVDHKNRNKSDDRIENLREATITQNNANKSSHKNSSSKYLGVSIHIFKRYVWANKNRDAKVLKVSKYWSAKICVNKKRIHIGIFKSEIKAARAYNKFAEKYFGEFANLNIVPVRKYIKKCLHTENTPNFRN